MKSAIRIMKVKARDMELAKKENQIKAQRSGFDLEEEAQRNERDLALRAGARDMELAPTR